MHHYIVFPHEGKKKKVEKEDLKSYTKKNLKPVQKKRSNYLRFDDLDINEVAAFSPEIDLHIEKLDPSAIKRSNAEIIRIQLKHCDDFLAKAIRLGQERVFIIHGIGKGRLRDSIASRLIQMPEVVSFKNEFHPRYWLWCH